MKPVQISKLYAKLTPNEQAALAFEASVNDDIADIEAIVSAVTRRNYIMPDREYMKRSDGLILLSWFYRGEYWKNLAMGFSLSLAGTPNKQNGKLVDKYAAKLAAMEVALNQVCSQLNVDVQAVRKVAECLEDLEPIPPGENHAELIKQYADLFISLF